MFEWFRKKPKSAFDEIVKATYGDSPPSEPPDLDSAVRLAHGALLMEAIDLAEVKDIAAKLNAGPMPYSTHGLALCAAMNLYRRPEHKEALSEAQLFARMTALQWTQEGLIPPALLQSFEHSLYTRFK